MAAAIGLGVAVELPEGVFNVIGEWQYGGMALQWWLWELDTGEGQTRLLARVGETFYTPVFGGVEAMPATGTLDVEGAQFTLKHHGEARAERATPGGRDFWLAQFRQYAAPGRALIFTADKDAIHRLLGQELEETLVQVYQG